MQIPTQTINAVGAETAEHNPTLEERIHAWLNRTPEEIAATRARILATSRKPRPLPPGKTLEDIIVGALPDDEPDEVILAALRDL